ncbi:DNA-DIRECTED RNA polymerase D SUBUNIT 2B-RELATED [Salix purpurea]|uniref:DNA-directed RNA polymerase n=1 Tax=Salix purpurea TaxID=77065 RepID=A0A9Q0ZEF2_SALPP|nr:DNA-DIRECTED RNA polymerase D SUBUNIT 2B-RELATED [Salix purpurea]
MGASSDYMEEVGPISKGEVDDMDMDEDLMDITNLNELGKELCKVSGLQRVFDSFGGVAVEPGYDTSKQKEGEWRRALVRLGKVTINRPSFWGGTSSDAEHNMFPSHARLQNMTYSVRMKIHVNVQVYTQTVGRSDKFKTGIDKVVQKNVVHTENREITIGRIDPYMDIVFALGVRSDKEVIDLIDYASNDASIVNIFFASIHDADEKCEHFRREDKALDFVDKMLNSREHEARFSWIYGEVYYGGLYSATGNVTIGIVLETGRFELASELLERELKVHVSHALRRMTKALQRDLYGDCDVHPIEHYLNASIVTNGLTRAFSTGAWCHPFKWMERVYGVVGNLGRANPLQTLLDLRKTRQQVLYTGKVGDARYPHPSHWGRVRFLSTPGGENCGLVQKKIGCHWSCQYQYIRVAS